MANFCHHEHRYTHRNTDIMD